MQKEATKKENKRAVVPDGKLSTKKKEKREDKESEGKRRGGRKRRPEGLTKLRKGKKSLKIRSISRPQNERGVIEGKVVWREEDSETAAGWMFIR